MEPAPAPLFRCHCNNRPKIARMRRARWTVCAARRARYAGVGERLHQAELLTERMQHRFIRGITRRSTAAIFGLGPKRTLCVSWHWAGKVLLARILQANPSSTGVLFDIPPVAQGARDFFSTAGLSERTEVQAGDFFESVPRGGDAYVLKHIIHDWNDDRATVILRNIAGAMAPEGRVLVVEQVIPPAGVPDFTKILDLEMLVLMDGGRERTVEEYESLFRHAGLTLERVISTRSPMSVVEARLA